MINNKDRPFPCLFGVAGYRSDMLRFAFFEEITASNIKEILIEFCNNYQSFGKKTSLVLFERPSMVYDINYYYKKFWKLLKELSEIDPIPWPDDIPEIIDNPAWEFCFNGVKMFVVCNTPAHINRLSRRSPSFTLTIQPRWVFEGLLDTEESATIAFKAVTERLEPYDIIHKSTLLGKYGELNNREAGQYFLDDDNDNNLVCPYQKLGK
ncbi:YqcI/YcgG family protein [uncultured Bartonella sp.]|uniref:YqcI/YcgG family protein n=1 Tax=uncultured Bartonella sp. TaxID=104108 RepID=UPI0025ED278E|nr:YqcI/YcgG family protein [uncultured Bartonella sp.]